MEKAFLEEYLSNPCQASSLPYWKSLSISILDNMKIIKDIDYDKNKYLKYDDTPYFKMLHSLKKINKPLLRDGFYLANVDTDTFANHINECYGESVTLNEVYQYTNRATYDKDLWIAIINDKNEVVASIIGELDKSIKEGIIEWVQVSKDYRKQGLGTYLVNELLSRLKNKASFVTVSGKLNSQSHPLKLYKKCGFVNETIWHVLKAK